MEWPWYEFVPGVGIRPSFSRDCAKQGVEQKERPRHLPPAQVAGRRAPPGMGREAGPSFRDHLRNVCNHLGIHPRFLRREGKGVVGIQVLQDRLEILEGGGDLGMLGAQVLLPVPPAADKVPVVQVLLNEIVGDGKKNRGLAARIRGYPVVGVGRTVGQADIKDDHLGAVPFSLDDALRVRVEVMP